MAGLGLWWWWWSRWGAWGLFQAGGRPGGSGRVLEECTGCFGLRPQACMVFDANWRAIFGFGRRAGAVDVTLLDDAGTALESLEYV